MQPGYNPVPFAGVLCWQKYLILVSSPCFGTTTEAILPISLDNETIDSRRRVPPMNTNPIRAYASFLCPHCGGECAPQTISMMLRRSADGFVLLQNVPADVCENCGEPQFSIATTGKVMSALNTERMPDDLAVVPVYNLAVKAE